MGNEKSGTCVWIAGVNFCVFCVGQQLVDKSGDGNIFG